MMPLSYASTFERTMKLSIKVIPGASKTEIAGWLGDDLKIRVAKPAQKGQANKAVQKVFSKSLGIPVGQIVIVAGQTSSRKIVEIDQVTESELKSKLGELGI